MNSEFPMTFIEPETKRHKARSKSARPHRSAHAEAVSSSIHRDVGAQKKVIPISHRSLSGFAQSAANGSSSGKLKNSLYPMSEFEEDAGQGRSQNYQRSPLRFLVRLVLALSLAATWIAIGMGELHSESSSVVSMRTYLSEKVPSIASVLQQKSETSAPLAEGETEPELSESMANSQIEQESLSTSPSEVSRFEAADEVSTGTVASERVIKEEQLESNEALPSRMQAVMAAPMSSNELNVLLDLFVEQGRQMQKMESHLLDLVKKNANDEQYSAFLASLKMRHQRALEMLKQQK